MASSIGWSRSNQEPKQAGQEKEDDDDEGGAGPTPDQDNDAELPGPRRGQGRAPHRQCARTVATAPDGHQCHDASSHQGHVHNGQGAGAPEEGPGARFQRLVRLRPQRGVAHAGCPCQGEAVPEPPVHKRLTKTGPLGVLVGIDPAQVGGIDDGGEDGQHAAVGRPSCRQLLHAVRIAGLAVEDGEVGVHLGIIRPFRQLLVPGNRLLEIIAAIGGDELVQSSFPRGDPPEPLVEIHAPRHDESERLLRRLHRIDARLGEMHPGHPAGEEQKDRARTGAFQPTDGVRRGRGTSRGGSRTVMSLT